MHGRTIFGVFGFGRGPDQSAVAARSTWTNCQTNTSILFPFGSMFDVFDPGQNFDQGLARPGRSLACPSGGLACLGMLRLGRFGFGASMLRFSIGSYISGAAFLRQRSA